MHIPIRYFFWTFLSTSNSPIRKRVSPTSCQEGKGWDFIQCFTRDRWFRPTCGLTEFGTWRYNPKSFKLLTSAKTSQRLSTVRVWSVVAGMKYSTGHKQSLHTLVCCETDSIFDYIAAKKTEQASVVRSIQNWRKTVPQTIENLEWCLCSKYHIKCTQTDCCYTTCMTVGLRFKPR